MRTIVPRLVVALTVLGCWQAVSMLTHAQVASARYNVAEVLAVTGSVVAAVGIDDGGFPQIVANGTIPGIDARAFVGTVGFMRDIGTLGGRRAEARGIQGGVAVGRAETATGPFHAFMSSSAGFSPPVDLGTLGGSESVANAVAYPYVVGASQTAGNTALRPFLYDDRTRILTELPISLGGRDAVATGINAAGHIVGYADGPSGQPHVAFLFVSGITYSLGSFGFASEAAAVNAADVVVGRAQLSNNGPWRAFRYQNGVIEDLRTLGGAASEAADVDAAGTIVGWAEDAAGRRRAFLWQNGTMTDLNTLIPSGSGWVLEAATGINSLGAIVGYGQRQGQRRAFMLTPPLDLDLSLRLHGNDLTTNDPNPHEAGQRVTVGATVRSNGPFSVRGVTVVHRFSGPIEIVDWFGEAQCQQSGLTLTCRMDPFDFSRDSFVNVRSTAPGAITHSASIVPGYLDPNVANNGATESNIAVSLATLAAAQGAVIGGTPVLTRATLTSPTPMGGARVVLSSSNPAVAAVPDPFDVLPGCCDGGLWREFYVATQPVTSPTTVYISATYGLTSRTVPLTIVPANSGLPFGTTIATVPGLIEAEAFDRGAEGVAYHDLDPANQGGGYRTSGVDIAAANDTGGGYTVGWIGAGEWLAYTVDVAIAGTYALEARVASAGPGGTFHMEVDGVDRTGPLTVPDSGGWQAWTTVTRPGIALAAGTRVLRVRMDTVGATRAVGNLNWLRLTLATPSSTPFDARPIALPGVIEAENFDHGPEGVAYHDRSAGNAGGAYRSTDVDLAVADDESGGYTVGWTNAGEWLAYTVNVATTGAYLLEVRVASYGPGGTFHLEANGVDRTGGIQVPDTGGWQTWRTISRPTVMLEAGRQVLRLHMDALGPTRSIANVNWLRLVPASKPFTGTPHPVPGLIEAEHFDQGAEGVAFHDRETGNLGGAYRDTGVDLAAASDDGGGYTVGWVGAGEWLAYTVTVATPGTYMFEARVASAGPGGRFRVEVNGVDRSGPIAIPDTGGWQTWTTIQTPIALPVAGVQRLVLWMISAGPSGAVGNLNWVRLTSAAGLSSTGGAR